MSKLSHLLRAACVTATLALCATGAAAQGAWPNKPVRIVVPFPPGGSTDLTARIIGPELAKRLGQTLVVENIAIDNTASSFRYSDVSRSWKSKRTGSGIVRVMRILGLSHDPTTLG